MIRMNGDEEQPGSEGIPLSAPQRSRVPFDEDPSGLFSFPEVHRAREIKNGGPWGDACRRVWKVMYDKPNALIVLRGPRGTGKTQMATSLARHSARLRLYRSMLYKKLREVFLAIKDGYSSDVSEAVIIRRFTDPDLLVLDEIAEREGNDWESRILTYIIDKRYDTGRKTTLLIGNIPPATGGGDPLVAAIGHSAYSRLIENGGDIDCSWSSFRV